ncbi:hypothetical protein KFE98_18650 [bacterium SCSIO 12741]|nr:hypothetical protein KFE98_18650 [bacterium SCSIO 12741]
MVGKQYSGAGKLHEITEKEHIFFRDFGFEIVARKGPYVSFYKTWGNYLDYHRDLSGWMDFCRYDPSYKVYEIDTAISQIQREWIEPGTRFALVIVRDLRMLTVNERKEKDQYGT